MTPQFSPCEYRRRSLTRLSDGQEHYENLKIHRVRNPLPNRWLQTCSNSIANAMDSLQTGTTPSNIESVSMSRLLYVASITVPSWPKFHTPPLYLLPPLCYHNASVITLYQLTHGVIVIVRIPHSKLFIYHAHKASITDKTSMVVWISR